MRRRILVFLAFLLIPAALATAQDAPAGLRVMTYNLRYDNPDDGANRWSARRDAVGALVRFHAPDIVCTQEGLRHQLDELSRLLDGYAWRGAGRDDGAEAGEHCAIFYRTGRFELLADSTFWLSPTPSVAGRAWDAALPRIVTWVHLRDRISRRDFFVFNTHFDHVGAEARRESARLIMREAPRIAGGRPVILAGDFNAPATDPPYGILTGKPAGGSFALNDTKLLSRERHFGPDGTCCGFEFPGPIKGGTIDFVFVGPGWHVASHATLSDMVGGRFPSDHLPVLTDLSEE